MIVTNLPSNTFFYSLLYTVNPKVAIWNLEPLIGKGFFNKHHSIAYVELKMYASPQSDFVRSQVIWNVPHDSISLMHPDYRNDIEKSLTFFLRHISALKGERINLTFEINDAAFERSSTRHHPFENATTYAIISCFDEKFSTFRQETIQNLAR